MSLVLQPCPQHGWLDADDCDHCKLLRRAAPLKPEEDHREKPYAKGLVSVTVTQSDYDAMTAELADLRAKINAQRLLPSKKPASAKGA